MGEIALRNAGALAVPTTKDLEALNPVDRWALEENLDAAQDVLRSYNDAELRGWVEEGKTQTEIAEIVGRSTSRINERCISLGLKARPSLGGRPRRVSGPGNADNESQTVEPEEVEGEVVEEPYQDPGPRVRCPTCGHMCKPGDIQTWTE